MNSGPSPIAVHVSVGERAERVDHAGHAAQFIIRVSDGGHGSGDGHGNGVQAPRAGGALPCLTEPGPDNSYSLGENFWP